MGKIKEEALDNQVIASSEALPKRDGLVWILCSRKGMGKSTQIYNALDTSIKDGGYKKFFNTIYICSPSMEADKKMYKLVNEVEQSGNFHDSLSNDILSEIIADAKSKPDKNSLLILDDCISLLPKSTQKNAIFNSLVCNCRHIGKGMSIWITVQKLKGVNATIRNNTDMISMYRTFSTTELKSYLDEFDVPKEIYERVTSKPHAFLHSTYTSGIPKFFDKYDEIT
jgi:hypothetical protein